MDNHFKQADKVINDLQELTQRIKDMLETIPVNNKENH